MTAKDAIHDLMWFLATIAILVAGQFLSEKLLSDFVAITFVIGFLVGTLWSCLRIGNIVYKFCSQCCRFLTLNHFRNSKSRHSKDGLNSYCIECAKSVAALKYLQNRDYYLIKSMEQHTQKLEEAGFPRDRRFREKSQALTPKHSHPWSRPEKWGNK
jgi:hypothetical protein